MESKDSTPQLRVVRDNTVRSVIRACEILRYLQTSTEEVSLDAVCKNTNLRRPTAYRLLSTMVTGGVVEKVSKNNYRLAGQQNPKKKLRFGYASQTEEFSFSRLVSESIRSSAYHASIDLLVLNNQYNPRAAIRNADTFVREHVDLVIEFQTNHQSASLVASKILEAGIPMIAIDIPHPGATYYGADNYKAGLIGGRALGHACVQQWGGAVDQVVLLELPIAGPLPRTRMVATLAGIREILPKFPDEKATFLDGKGRFEDSLLVVRKYLAKNNSKKILLAALNDPSCLGGLQAFEEFGRSQHCLAVGQNASIEARREMRRPSSRLIGSVAYFPERYGEAVIALALDKVQGRDIPSAAFVKHRLITRANVDVAYPNDSQINSADTDSLLFSKH